MINKEKSREIVDSLERRYADTKDLLWSDVYDAVIEMAQWKDEGFLEWLKKIDTYTAKDKSKYIKFAIEFLEGETK